MPAKEPTEWKRLNLKVPKDVAEFWRGKRLASSTFADATMPLVKENGESLGSVTARLRGLLREDAEAHEADIRRHAEIEILQRRIRDVGGEMLHTNKLDIDTLDAQMRYATWKKSPAHVTKGTQRDALAWCDRELRRIPSLKSKFPTPDDLFIFLEGHA